MAKGQLIIAAAALAAAAPGVTADPWASVTAVLEAAIEAQVFPGCSAGVRTSDGRLVYEATLGNLTYGNPPPPMNGGANPPVDSQTRFDMASCSKIVGPTTVSAYLYQQGFLDLDMLVADPSLLGPDFAQQGKGSITLRNLLLHDSGFPPDPTPNFWDPSFPCPATNGTLPVPLTFSCQQLAYNAVLNQTLQYPTGTQYVYSDLSMITMLYVLGTVIQAHSAKDPVNWVDPARDFSPSCAAAGPVASMPPALAKTCYYEGFWRAHIVPRAGLNTAQYILPREVYPFAAPTWNDSIYRQDGVQQGVVSDENAYALGGIAGHAGVFATGRDIGNWLAVWQFAPQPASMPRDVQPGRIQRPRLRTAAAFHTRSGVLRGAERAAAPPSALLNRTTVTLFTTVYNATFSPRALGWLTQTPLDTYQGCGGLAPTTAYHTGYTGTLICYDPTRQLTTYLLAARVYPNKTNNAVAIQGVRQEFNDAVLAALQAQGLE